jgi:hypothetical protein
LGDINRNNLPRFDFKVSNDVYFDEHRNAHIKKPSLSITADGVRIYDVTNPDEFYSEFGYSSDIAKAGKLPDEFIWDEYTKNSIANRAACKQKHLIEYLLRHAGDDFRKKCGVRCVQWLIAHIDAITELGDPCVTCKPKSFCSLRERHAF